MSQTAAAATKHVCKFLRHRFKSGNITYFCANGCNKKIAPALSLGKPCICWRCGNVFIMNEYSIRLAKPHCDACHKPKGSENAPEVDIQFVSPSLPPTIQTLTPQSASTIASLSERLRLATSAEPILSSANDEDEL